MSHSSRTADGFARWGLLISLVACGSGKTDGAVPTPRPAPSGLWGTGWLLEDLAGEAVLDGTRATLEFPEPGKAVGSGSCNRFVGGVQVSGDSIGFGPLGSTRMACSAPVMRQERGYLQALERAERYSANGATLLISIKGTGHPLRFTRLPPGPR